MQEIAYVLYALCLLKSNVVVAHQLISQSATLPGSSNSNSSHSVPLADSSYSTSHSLLVVGTSRPHALPIAYPTFSVFSVATSVGSIHPPPVVTSSIHPPPVATPTVASIHPPPVVTHPPPVATSIVVSIHPPPATASFVDSIHPPPATASSVASIHPPPATASSVASIHLPPATAPSWAFSSSSPVAPTTTIHPPAAGLSRASTLSTITGFEVYSAA